MRKLIFALITLITLAVMIRAQEVTHDRAKLYLGFTNGNVDSPVLNQQGINAAAQIKVYGYEGVKLEAVGDFAAFLSGPYSHSYTYLAGPQVGINLFEGRLNPFVRVMFGTLRVDGENYYGHSLGGGIDVNITNRIFVRGSYDKQSFEVYDIGQPIHRISVGAGLRF